MLNKQKKEDSQRTLKDIKEGISKRTESDSRPYLKILEDMAEGKRQLGIETPDSVLGELVKNFPIAGKVPSYMERVGSLMTNEGRLKRTMKNEPYFRDLYQLGKNKETGTPDPKLGTISKMADKFREDYNLNDDQFAQVMQILGDFGLLKAADKEIVKRPKN